MTNALVSNVLLLLQLWQCWMEMGCLKINGTEYLHRLVSLEISRLFRGVAAKQRLRPV